MNTFTQLAARLPMDIQEPDAQEVPKVKEGLDTMIGIFLFIGPYIFALGLIAGVVWLVVGMFGHGEMKGGKWMAISIVAAILFGSVFSILNFFLD